MTGSKLNPPIYVISDLHLNSADPKTLALLLKLLEPGLFRARSLVILGDLFDVWLGDDVPNAIAELVATHLKRLSLSGVSVYFLPGNRDFLMGNAFCQAAGMELLHEPLILASPQSGVGLIHGDVLCTEDGQYQRFREKTRQPDWQRKILSLPIIVRRMLGYFARWKSQRHGQKLEIEAKGISDAAPEAITKIIAQHGLRHLIHGHTHRMGIHRLTPSQATRWVLGDWHEAKGSVITINDDEIALHSIRLSEDQQTITWSKIEPSPAH